MDFTLLSDHAIQDLIDNAQTAETRRIFQAEFDRRYTAAQKTIKLLQTYENSSFNR